MSEYFELFRDRMNIDDDLFNFLGRFTICTGFADECEYIDSYYSDFGDGYWGDDVLIKEGYLAIMSVIAEGIDI